VQERKGGRESSVLHSADITQFCLRKSISGSKLTVTVISRDVCITPDTYLCAREESGSESILLHSADLTQFSLKKSLLPDHI
jgi:hypothetical protein